LWQQPFSHLPLRIGYIPKGPLVDWANVDQVTHLLDCIERYARSQRCVFVKIDPNVREDSRQGRMLLTVLQQRSWRYSRQQIQFKNTAYSDLRTGEDALLAGMKSKWRYNIRLSRRRGINVRCGDERDLRAFYSLYAETGERDGFIIRPYEYYETAWQVFMDADRQPDNPAGGALLLAEHEKEVTPVAGLFLLRYQDLVWYFYGASSERRRRDMPNHLLQWEAIRWSMKQGCTLYDWWGAPTYLTDRGDAMQGVWQFKQGFGAQFQSHVGAWDYPVFPPAYNLYTRAIPHAIALVRRLS
jgi:lipid II:glycine glycyltransferase (peptidoglycan interpeptide bridge formation enzyme)